MFREFRILEKSDLYRRGKNMGYLLIVLISVVSGLCPVLKKKYVKDTEGIMSSTHIYMFIICPLTTLYYFILAKGEVPLNWPTFRFALIFGLVSVGCTIFNMMGYRYTNLVYISIFSGAGGTVIPFLYEMIFRGEIFSVFEILSVVLRLAAVSVPLLLVGKTQKSTNIGFVICGCLFVLSGLATIISKLYAQHPNVCSDRSFCFWTNVVSLPFVLMIVLKQTGIKTIVRESKKIKKLDYLYVILSMMLGNICTLISIQVLRMVSATVYSVLSSSLVLVVTALVSRILYKEKLSKQGALSLAFSILAIVAGVL